MIEEWDHSSYCFRLNDPSSTNDLAADIEKAAREVYSSVEVIEEPVFQEIEEGEVQEEKQYPGTEILVESRTGRFVVPGGSSDWFSYHGPYTKEASEVPRIFVEENQTKIMMEAI